MRYSIIGATVEQVKSAGGQDIKETRTGIIFATLTDSQVERLKEARCIIRPLGEVRTAVMPPVPVTAVPTYSTAQLMWATGLEQLRSISDPPLYGGGINLAIIDTGVRETHEQIGGRIVYRKNFTADPHRDGFDHGTGVASLALVVAPMANIIDFKVLDDKGMGTEEEVVLAIDEALSLHDKGSEFAPWVINLSLGSPDDGDPYNPLRVACRAAIERGIWVIAAAGNTGPSPQTIMCPASERYVTAVGSARFLADARTFVVSNFSSRGPTREGLVKPDVVLFGEDVVVASSTSDTATVAKSGTSFATPFASGLAILYYEGVLAYGGVRYPEGPPSGIFPEITELVSSQQLLDRYLPGLCIKPQGSPAVKDYEYGYGLPFGPLITQALSPRPAVDLSSLVPAFSALMMVGMVGMMMRGTLVGGRSGR